MDWTNWFAFCQWINQFSSSSPWLWASKPQIKNTKIRLFLRLNYNLPGCYVYHTHLCEVLLLNCYIATSIYCNNIFITVFAFLHNTIPLNSWGFYSQLKHCKKVIYGKNQINAPLELHKLLYYSLRSTFSLIFMEAEHSHTKKSLLLTKKRLDI